MSSTIIRPQLDLIRIKEDRSLPYTLIDAIRRPYDYLMQIFGSLFSSPASVNHLTKVSAGGSLVVSSVTDDGNGTVTIGNTDTTALATTPPDPGTGIRLIVGNSEIAGPPAEVAVIRNTSVTATPIGSFAFANYNLAATDKRIAVINGTTDNAPNSGMFNFFTSDAGTIAERMRLTSPGNVGIGNSAEVLPHAPAGYTHLIVGPTAAGTSLGEITTCGNSASDANMGTLSFANYAIGVTEKRIAQILALTAGGTNSGALLFFTANAGALGERMRITAAGNVGIANTAPLVRLAVTGTSQPQGDTAGIAHLTTGTGAVTDEKIQIGIVDGGYGWIQAIKPGTGFRSLVLQPTSGSVGIGVTNPTSQLQLSFDSAAKPGTNTWTVASDGRLKRNIQPFTHGLETLVQFKPITYEYNGEGDMPEGLSGVGLIAQEAQDVYAPCVRKAPGNIAGEDTEILGINTNDLTWMAVNAFKEIESRLRKLEEKEL